MARVPVPVTQGAQKIGGVQPIAADTPFQKFQTNADMFRAASGRAAEGLAGALDAGADFFAAKAAENDKRELTKADTEMSEALVIQQQELEAKKGQDRLDALFPKGHPGLVDAGDEAAAVGERTAQSISSKYSDKLSTAGKEALNTRLGQLTAGHRVELNKQRIEAQALVDTQLMTGRISAAAESAASAVGTDAFPSNLAKSLSAVESSVTDPDIGLAKQNGVTDQKLIDQMIKEQKGIVIGRSADTLIAKGDLAGAQGLIEEYTKEGGALSGSKAAATLIAKITPYKNEIKGRKEFGAVMTSLGSKPSLAQIVSAVQNEPDPQKRSRLETAYRSYATTNSAHLKESIDRQATYVVGQLAQGLPVDVTKIPDYVKAYPEAALRLQTGQRSRAAAIQVQKSDTQKRWEETGGGTYNEGASENLKRMATNTPAAFVKIMKGDVPKKIMAAEQHAALKQLAATISSKIDDKVVAVINVDRALTALGYDKKRTRTNLVRKYGASITDVTNEVRDAAIATGKPINPDDVQQAIAGLLIRVQSDDGVVFDTYDAAVTVAAGDPELDIDTLPLSDSTANKKMLVIALGRTEAQIEKAFEEATGEVTLESLATTLGVSTPMDARAALEERENMRTMANDAGFPLDFVTFLLSKVEGARVNTAGASQMILQMTAPDASQKSYFGKTTQELFEIWLGVQ